VRGGVHYVPENRKTGEPAHWRVEVRFTLAGEKGRWSKRFPTKKAARTQQALWDQKIENALALERLGARPERAGPRPSLTSLCEELLAETDVRENTRDGYRIHVHLHILPFFGADADPRDITSRDIRAFAQHLRQGDAERGIKPHAPEGVKRILSTLHQVLLDAYDAELIDRDPFPRRRRGRREAAKPAWRILTYAELDALLAGAEQLDIETRRVWESGRPRRRGAGELWRTFFLVAVRTGIRMGEQRESEWDDVIDAGSRLHITRRTVWRAETKAWDLGPPKSGYDRKVPLTLRLGGGGGVDAQAALGAWPRTLGTDRVFPGRRAGYRSNDHITTALRRACRLGGVEGHLRPHDLRHTWASHALATGYTVAEVMEWGGWRTLAMVTRYLHAFDDSVEALQARLAEPPKSHRAEGPATVSSAMSGMYDDSASDS